jgi:predicted enzyme involved in methoxymalonyl-ACP biosynthesis
MTMPQHAIKSEEPKVDKKTIKLLVWDLDNTLWQGTLLEGDKVSPNPSTVSTIKALDERGILHFIASKNDHDIAMAKLKEFGIDKYFLYPQVNWNS